jgi:hypothetical protein
MLNDPVQVVVYKRIFPHSGAVMKWILGPRILWYMRVSRGKLLLNYLQTGEK